MTAFVRRYLGIARELARIGLVRKSQFRVEFLSQIVMDCVWYTTKILVFEVLYLYADNLAGWRLADIRVYLGCVFVSDAFMMMWLGQRWRFARDLKDGKLDPVRVRPASPVFLYFFQQFSIEAVFNMVVANGYLIYGLAAAGAPLTLARLPLYLWATALSWWAMTVCTVLFSINEFWLTNSDLGLFFSNAFEIASSNPLDVYGRYFRQLLVWAIPVGVFTYVPACMLLGRIGPGMALAHSAWMLAAGALVFRAWRWSFRRYESAMS